MTTRTDRSALAEALSTLIRRPRVLVAVDFDGTLAPIVSDPASARPLPTAVTALRALAAAPGVTVALVSGREIEALRELAAPPPGAVLIGAHGAQRWTVPVGSPEEVPLASLAPSLDATERARLDQVRADLTWIAQRFPGCWVEHKDASCVLHTRSAGRPEARAATEAALSGPAARPGVWALAGKEVVELTVHQTSKGMALGRLRDELDLPVPGGGVFFAGDDVTDERAFEVLADENGDLTVKVGPGETRARHRVPDPADVAELLATAAALRSAGGG